MTDEYTARERALLLAREDDRIGILSAKEITERAEDYLAFLMSRTACEDGAPIAHITQDAIDIWTRTNSFVAQLKDGGIAG